MFINVFTSHMNLRNSTGNSPNCLVFDVFSFHPPKSMGLLVGNFHLWCSFSLTTTFFRRISHQRHTPPHHQPPHHPPPSLPPNHSNTPRWRHRTTWANSSLCWNFCGRTSWPKSQRSGRGNNNSAEIYRCCGWHTLPETGRWIFLFAWWPIFTCYCYC